MKKSSTFGFTLAEVLITLGIIGVVSAITIPNLMENVRNRDLQVQLKKTYSEWNQISMSFMEEHEQSIPDYAAKYGVDAMITELQKYIKGFSKFSDWTWQKIDEEGSNLTTKPYQVYTFSGTKTNISCDLFGYRSDLSGKYILFDDKPVNGYNGPRLCIDLNGNKKPNILGVDIFNFQFTTDGHIIPEGAEHPDNNYIYNWQGSGTVKASLETCRKGTHAYDVLTCAYYAIHDISPKGNGTYWKDYIGKKLYKK